MRMLLEKACVDAGHSMPSTISFFRLRIPSHSLLSLQLTKNASCLVFTGTRRYEAMAEVKELRALKWVRHKARCVRRRGTGSDNLSYMVIIVPESGFPLRN